MKKPYAMDMCSGPLGKQILRFVLPLMASNLLQTTFNLADVLVVGKFAGDLSQAAVTSTTSLINLLLAIFLGLAGGANVVLSHALGARDHDRVKDIVHTCVALAFTCGVLLMTAGLLTAPFLLTLIKSPADVKGLSLIYLRIYFLGIPATLAYNFSSAILRANGDTRRPMFFLTLGGIINVTLNLITVIGFGMGVAGVATATVVSQWISALLVLRCLRHEDGLLHLSLRRLCLKPDTLAKITRLGIPAGFSTAMFSLANTVIQSSVNSLDAIDRYKNVVIAGSGAAITIETICYQVTGSFFFAAMPFVAQNYGAKNLNRINRSFLWCLCYAVSGGILTSLVTLLCSGPILRLFTDDLGVVAQGQLRLQYIIPFLALCGAMDTCGATLRGLGWSMLPTITALVGVCGVRLLWISTVFRANPCPENIYISYPISWAIAVAFNLCALLIARRKVKREFAPQCA